MSFLVCLIILLRKDKLVPLFCLSFFCRVDTYGLSLRHGAIGWSVIGECGTSWSYAIYIMFVVLFNIVYVHSPYVTIAITVIKTQCPLSVC